MSASVRDRQDSPEIELGTAISWPAVYAAMGLAVLVLVAVCTLFLFSASHAGPVPQPPLARKRTVPVEDQMPFVAIAPEPRPVAQQRPPSIGAVDSSNKSLPGVPEPTLPTTAVAEPTPLVAAAAPAPAVDASSPSPAEDVAAAPAPPPPPEFKRRQLYLEDHLRQRLASESREVDLEAVNGTAAMLLEEAKKAATAGEAKAGAKSEKIDAEPPILAFIARRSDLQGLRVREASECRVDSSDARKMERLSGKVRRLTAIARRRARKEEVSEGELIEAGVELAVAIGEELKCEAWHEETGVRLAVQMLQAESYPVRLQLVKSLAPIKSKYATEALARRAAFDLASDIRETAIAALKDRPEAEYRKVFLEALRYPWAPVADHAAEALVNLKAHKMVPDLLGLLDAPDPRAPTRDTQGKWVKAELVRVNHLANCMLCHAPSSSRHDLVRGLVPVRGKEIPIEYYARESGDFVRADVTYLKQDFSVVQPVPQPDRWPAEQRFDFLIRLREITAADVPTLPAGGVNRIEPPTTYQQREAVLWALRELTGKDAGQKTADWRQMFLDIWPKEKF
jgi:hypothetical protein